MPHGVGRHGGGGWGHAGRWGGGWGGDGWGGPPVEIVPPMYPPMPMPVMDPSMAAAGYEEIVGQVGYQEIVGQEDGAQFAPAYDPYHHPHPHHPHHHHHDEVGFMPDYEMGGYPANVGQQVHYLQDRRGLPLQGGYELGWDGGDHERRAWEEHAARRGWDRVRDDRRGRGW